MLMLMQIPADAAPEGTLKRSTWSLKAPKGSVRSLMGSLRRKIITDKTAAAPEGHVCEPIREGMSMCQCGRRW